VFVRKSIFIHKTLIECLLTRLLLLSAKLAEFITSGQRMSGAQIDMNPDKESPHFAQQLGEGSNQVSNYGP
jgi:hypothetical protein